MTLLLHQAGDGMSTYPTVDPESNTSVEHFDLGLFCVLGKDIHPIPCSRQSTCLDAAMGYKSEVDD
jgi:hypothetical protein